VLLEQNSANITQTRYTYGMGRILAQTKSGNTQFLLPDAQGSTRLLINNSASTQQTYNYRAFGEMVTTPSPLQTRYLYTAQQFDSTTKLYSLRARSYSPTIGRFFSQDTYPYNFQNPVEINRYVYGINNPVRWMDASGMSITSDYGKLGAFALTVGGILSRIPPQTKNWLGDLYWGIGRLLTPEQWDELADMLIGAGRIMLAQTGVQELTQTKKKEKKSFDIALGTIGEDYRDRDLLEMFTSNLNMKKEELQIKNNVVEYREWAYTGLLPDEWNFMDRAMFAAGFATMTIASERIHFNLEGLSESISWIITNPSNNNINTARSITAWELYTIVNTGLCTKTTFYRNGSSNPAPLNNVEKSQICIG
jgi:RHS repeat-associated protein